MKLKEGFILREVAGETVVLPSDATLNLNMMITLNETGKFLWEQLQIGAEKEDLVTLLCRTYEVDAETAANHVDRFVNHLQQQNFLA